MNRAILIGRLGRDPELRSTQDGTQVANLSLATSERWRDKNTGEKREKTEWHRVVLWGKTAEIAGQYCNKGDQIAIEGKIETRKWQDQSGQDRYTTEIRGERLHLLGGGSGDSSQQNQNSDSGFSADDYRNASDGGGAADLDDEIPF